MTDVILIKRYRNRKLYDTLASKYITLADIRFFVTENLPIKVIRYDGMDVTAQTLAFALSQVVTNATTEKLATLIREAA